jgi:hypothetical protein
MVTPVRHFSQQTFLLRVRTAFTARLPPVWTTSALPDLAASGVDWSEVHAVRLLGIALAALILLWAIRRMFGGK